MNQTESTYDLFNKNIHTSHMHIYIQKYIHTHTCAHVYTHTHKSIHACRHMSRQNDTFFNSTNFPSNGDQRGYWEPTYPYIHTRMHTFQFCNKHDHSITKTIFFFFYIFFFFFFSFLFRVFFSLVPPVPHPHLSTPFRVQQALRVTRVFPVRQQNVAQNGFDQLVVREGVVLRKGQKHDLQNASEPENRVSTPTTQQPNNPKTEQPRNRNTLKTINPKKSGKIRSCRTQNKENKEG